MEKHIYKAFGWRMVAMVGSLLGLSLQAQLVIDQEFLVNQSIPDFSGSSTVGILDSRNLQLHSSGRVQIEDLEIGLDIAGRLESGFNGDLFAQVSHTNEAEEDRGFAILANRPGVEDSNSFGYPDNGMDVVFSDEAADGFHFYREAPGFEVNEAGQVIGSWQPDKSKTGLPEGAESGSMASFEHFSPNGDWNLFVEDRSAGGLHELADWVLKMQLSLDPDADLILGPLKIGPGVNNLSTSNTAELTDASEGTLFESDKDWEWTGELRGAGKLVKSGDGRLDLSGANRFEGGSEIRAGILGIDHESALGGGELTFKGGGLSVASAADFELANSVRVDADAELNVPSTSRLGLAGAFSGDRSLEKTGGGTLLLRSQSPDFSGGFRLSKGLTQVNGDFSGAETRVGPGAVLGGSGSVGPATLEGGVLRPGVSPGTLAIEGDLSVSQADEFQSSYVWEINRVDGVRGEDPGWDWIHVTGKLTLGESVTRENPVRIEAKALSDLNAQQPFRWTIFTADGGLFDSDAASSELDLLLFQLDSSEFSDLGDLNLAVSDDLQNLTVEFTPIPEPAWTAAVTGVFLLGAAACRRRWKASNR